MAEKSLDAEIISIHALREESDPCNRRPHLPTHISIHALREESDSTVDPAKHP